VNRERDDRLRPFRPLARHALATMADAATTATWEPVLAALLEAAARGVGHLAADELLGDRDPTTRPMALIALEDGRLLLPRTAAAWRRIRDGVEARWREPGPGFDDAAVRTALDAILPAERIADRNRVVFDTVHQRLAAASLVDARIGVLTGGPGTGKTTTAAALLALRARLDPSLTTADVLVCAPTGKAATRLRLALGAAADRLGLDERERELLTTLRPATLHRALGWTPQPPERGGPFRHGPHHRLPQRLVLMDEASMADVELTAALVAALRDDAALILLGDRDQLDSVEAGGVLAELVARGGSGELDPVRRTRLEARVGDDAATHWRDALPAAAAPAGAEPLPGLAVGLAWSYRARTAPWILELAEVVRPRGGGDVTAVTRCCAEHAADEVQWLRDRLGLDAMCAQAWAALAATAADWRPAAPPEAAALQRALDAFQLLVATNRQVAAANARGRAVLAGDDAASGPLLHGSPLMVEANDRALDLANGEIGIALGDGPGSVGSVAVVPGQAAPIPLARLPRHRAAFAITVHKSQGSEWRHVAIDLPDHAEDLLDRHLLYTAVTRSSRRVTLAASETALRRILDPT